MIGGQAMYEESLRSCGQVPYIQEFKRPRVDVTVCLEVKSPAQIFSQRFIVSRIDNKICNISVDDGTEDHNISTITVTREELSAIMQALGSV